MQPSAFTAEQLQRALELAFRYLNRRARTSVEMREHLLARGLDPAIVDAALDDLTGSGYLDDARFAELFVEDKRALEGWGADRISRELVAKGVERELIEAALAECSEEGELERALGLLRRRLPAPPADGRSRERALGVLLRKGYDYELACEALSAYIRS